MTKNYDTTAADNYAAVYAYSAMAEKFDELMEQGKYEDAEAFANALIKSASKIADGAAYRRDAKDKMARLMWAVDQEVQSELLG